MKLSLEQRTDRALRALRLLGQHDEPVRGRDLAGRLGTSPQYLPHVVRPLVRAGWVRSDPGPHGGYRLATDLQAHSLLALIELMEGPTDSKVCVLRRGPCGEATACELHHPWVEARDALLERLDATPLSGPTT